MARKSQAQRLDDAKATLKLWEDAGLSQAKPALFISQMVQSMERGRYPSAGQRKWLDSLTEEGVNAFPVIHNPEISPFILRRKKRMRVRSTFNLCNLH